MREGIPRPDAMPRCEAIASWDCSSAREAGPACRAPAPDVGERLIRHLQVLLRLDPWACKSHCRTGKPSASGPPVHAATDPQWFADLPEASPP